jgi:hypothetical protein
MGSNGIFMGFNGILWVLLFFFYGNLMEFNGFFMGFLWDLMGFYGIFIGI